MFPYITKYAFIILSYEIITVEVIRTKIIDIILDKLIYIIFCLLFYSLGYFTKPFLSCCWKQYSKEEKEILKFIKAGDKMNLQGAPNALQYYRDARSKIDSSTPFIDISPDILKKMDKIESEFEIGKYEKKNKNKKKGKKSD